MIRNYLKDKFPLLVYFRNRVINHLAHFRFLGKDAEKVFEKIYLDNHWRDQESRSGVGSNTMNSEETVKIVEHVLNEYAIESILDIPCGDFNWMKKVDLNRKNYLSADIVNDIIVNNNEEHASTNVTFRKINLINENLLYSDLVITRDCLVHFSYSDINKAIKSVLNSGSKYWLVTTFPEHHNYNIITGDWRPLNLQSPPFNFPPPIALFSERYQGDKRHSDKSLGLWRIGDLRFENEA